ncbi:hypothetical protein D1871_14515 [Nakamurella silvestris]|nr:hypothetical protein D1871_14515 [Nakamurella silvestris]
MPTFTTPEPISLSIDVVAGQVNLLATDRADTLVEVRPGNPAREADTRAADQTTIDFNAGRLEVRTPRTRALSLFGKPGSVEVAVSIPVGSAVQIEGSLVQVQAGGRVGECRVKVTAGDIHLDHTGPLEAATGSGTVVVVRVDGHAEIRTGTGKIRVGQVLGNTRIKNSNGHSWITGVGGDLRVTAANGDIFVGRAESDVTAKSANGDIRLEAAVRGTTELKTAAGDIEIGVPSGTAALLDLHTAFGRVRSLMEVIDEPAAADETAAIHANTSYGDIVVRRTEESFSLRKE